MNLKKHSKYAEHRRFIESSSLSLAIPRKPCKIKAFGEFFVIIGKFFDNVFMRFTMPVCKEFATKFATNFMAKTSYP